MSTIFYLTTATSFPYALTFSVIPPPSTITNIQREPFKLSLSAADQNTHIIDLYAQYSKSLPYQLPQNKWSQLVPQWRFTDVDGNFITQITTTDTPVYSGTEIIGVTGYADFYYIDDIASTLGYPIILWATLTVSALPLLSESKNSTINIPSYANSKVIACIPYYINGMLPKDLHITRNGVTPLSTGSYWVNMEISNIITIHGNDYAEFGCSNSSALYTLFDYPSSNQHGINMGAISKQIITIPLSSQVWTSLDNGTTNTYFQKYDENLLNIGGYVRNKVVSNITSINNIITAGVDVKYKTYHDTPFVWISNPEENKIYKLHKPYVDQTIIDRITSWINGFNNNDTSVTYDTPMLTTPYNIMSLTGFGGIYGIAIDPCYNTWCSDSEMDKLYKFNYNGELLLTIDLTDTTNISAISGGGTPAGLSIDSKNNLWVSLFDSSNVLKFDGMTGEFLTTINTYVTSVTSDPTYKPTLVETDSNDNVWVSYTNPLCSCLIKYNSNGTQITSITLPTCSNPMDLCFDKDQNLWATLTYHSYFTPITGNVIKIDTTNYTIVSNFYYKHPEYLTVDPDNNIWFTYGFNNVGKINNSNGIITTNILGVSTEPLSYDIQNYNAIEGIAADSIGRVYVINSLENKIYILSGNNTIIETITAYDFGKFTYRFDDNITLNQISAYDEYSKSLQAFGDWTGLRFIHKYNSESMYITGESSLFDIEDFNGYDLRKFNESFDTTAQIRSYAIPEFLNNNYNLFENYIGSMVGGLETSANSIGKEIYEKTANFVENNVDIDTCNINQLYSLANELDVPIDDYNIHIPAELKRIMDIVSINHKTLWGDRCKCNYNFKNGNSLCDNCNHEHNTNRGDSINTDNYIVSSGITILAEYKFNKNHYDIITPMVSSSTIFGYVSTYLLNDPEDYCYYSYIPNMCNYQSEGIINWADEYTTISEQVSGLEDWYGINQMVEKMINYYLHKGLGF